MLTALYGLICLGFDGGVMLWLLFWMLVLGAYFVLFRRFPANRERPEQLLGGALVAELLVDGIWSLVYLGSPGFAQVGAGLVYGLPLWAGALAVCGILATAQRPYKGEEK